MNLAMKSVIVVLALAIVILGYKIYEGKSKMEPSSSAQIETETSTVKTETATETSPTPKQEVVEKTPETKISSADRAVLTGAIPSADPKRTEYFNLVSSYAVSADTVDATSCSVAPIVASIKNGTSVTFTNKGAAPIVLNFGPGQDLNIAANSSAVYKGFSKGPGVYGYGCSMKSGVVGLILVM